MNKFILFHDNLNWYLNAKVGKIVAYHTNDLSRPVKEFYVGNPPAIEDKEDHNLFISVCEFARSKRLLRKIDIYAVM